MDLHHKSLGYIIRNDGGAVRLLAFRSHDADGYEVPRGSLYEGESPEQALLREIAEESGIHNATILRKIGISYWQNEAQHFYLLDAPPNLPDAFSHTVQSADGDHGRLYHYVWLPLSSDLYTQLVEGCDYFVEDLLKYMTRPNVIFTTERAERHQQANLDAAPEGLHITMLRSPDVDTLKAHLRDADYWISERRGTINADMLANAPDLKLIQRVGTLTYDIDLQAAQSRGIIVCEQPLGSVIRVAEHVLMQMLALTKRLSTVQSIALDAADTWGESKRTDENTFAYNWSKQTGIGGLWRKTVGILGFGEIGLELARRLQGFGCHVLYNKREPLPQHTESTLNINYTPLDSLLAESDLLVNLLPYSAATDHFLNAERFARMKDGACLVSAGSGSVIDEIALANALERGTLSGVALDTYEYEPIRAGHPLISLANRGYNILLTPHTAAGNIDANVNERAEIYDNLSRHLRGEALLNRVV